jgi:hypothetical protein
MKNGTLLTAKDMQPGMFVLAKFHNTDHPQTFDYLEIGIIRENLMRHGKEQKLECLILTDAAFGVDYLPNFSATPHPPFLSVTTKVVEIDENEFYSIDSKYVETLLDKQQECLKMGLQAAQAELNGFIDLRDSLKRVQADTKRL